LHGHVLTDVNGSLRELSAWAPVVSSDAVTRAVLAAVARWSGKLALLKDAVMIACASSDAGDQAAHIASCAAGCTVSPWRPGGQPPQPSHHGGHRAAHERSTELGP